MPREEHRLFGFSWTSKLTWCRLITAQYARKTKQETDKKGFDVRVFHAFLWNLPVFSPRKKKGGSQPNGKAAKPEKGAGGEKRPALLAEYGDEEVWLRSWHS